MAAFHNHTRLRQGFARWQLVLLLAALGGLFVAISSLAPRWRGASKKADLAAEAKEYLRERDVQPLAADLDKLLASHAKVIPALPHALLGNRAPDFELSDHLGRTVKLSEHLQRGPVVVVFYLGYYCNHCVSQLFALQEDLGKFHELGAEILAISPDSSQETSRKFAQYGKFTFPVLADQDKQTAAAYSVYGSPAADKPPVLLHGTFVIDHQGIVRWCHYGHEPFTDNATLLVELAKARSGNDNHKNAP